jgi:hypothetical protein
MVTHGRLGDLAAGREVARTDAIIVGQLPQDRQAGRVRRSLQEEDVWVARPLHGRMVLTTIDICKYQYATHLPRRRSDR